MQVMIIEEDATLRTQIIGALAPEGVDILSFGRLAPAKEAARRASVDILVLGETIEGRLASDVALLAEWRNPRLGSILLSDRDAEDAEELFDIIPSLQAVLGRRTGPRTLARVAIATARAREGVNLRPEDESDVGLAAMTVDQPPAERNDAEAHLPAHFAIAVEPAPAAPPEETAPIAACAAPVPHPKEPEPSLAAADPVGPHGASSAPATPTGVLFALPSFLRETEDEAGETVPDALSVPAASLSFLAAPTRRLHLA